MKVLASPSHRKVKEAVGMMRLNGRTKTRAGVVHVRHTGGDSQEVLKFMVRGTKEEGLKKSPWRILTSQTAGQK